MEGSQNKNHEDNIGGRGHFYGLKHENTRVKAAVEKEWGTEKIPA